MSMTAETPSSPSNSASQHLSRHPSSSSIKGKSPDHASRSAAATPQKSSLRSRPSKSSIPGSQEPEESVWGSNFWVTLVDPQTQTSFFACPATGQVSWDAPVGNFVLPPSADGEWWEITDESRGGLPYYYQTKTGETVWERPEGFVIPLGILQNTALGRRLSNRFSQSITTEAGTGAPTMSQTPERPSYRRSQTFTNGQEALGDSQIRKSLSTQSPNKPSLHTGKKQNGTIRRSISSEQYGGSTRAHLLVQQLPPIPASPYGTDASEPATPASSRHSLNSTNTSPRPKSRPKTPNSNGKNTPTTPNGRGTPDSQARARSKSSSYVSHRPPQPQSLSVAVELLTSSQSDSGQSGPKRTAKSSKESSGGDTENLSLKIPSTPISHSTPPSPRRPIPAIPSTGNTRPTRNVSAPNIAGKEISAPILNHAATLDMSPVKDRAAGKPIPVERQVPLHRTPTTTLSTGTYPALPHDLASDIQQFSESDYAKQYFSKHSTGFIFKRQIPVAQLMTWQKAPLSSPLLALNRSLHRDAVKVFKVIQHIMGDRDRDKAVGVRAPSDTHVSTVASINASTTSLGSSIPNNILDEERWLLGEGITHGEMRDEIYCQVMKQLNKNPNPESGFKGWQLLCVLLITFPPSKNFETYLRSFMQKHTSIQEGRVDVMAKYCLRRLDFISKKGPRGKSPTIAEIETASDAAFNPSTFGESLDAIIRLQQRNYPQQKIPIILPFLADGILALGGTKSEGIFRVPGDGDSVSELKLRIDRGYYNLDGVDDPHILASLMKLWLRELCDPLVPEEMYNECVMNSKDPEACVHIVQRLPTINRRVVLFVISFLQLFLEEKVQSITKMTPANLALVMAPNLLRCNSDSTSIVFTNAQYEQIFVYNLLLHLKCGEADSDYAPVHGLGAVEPSPAPRKSKSRARPQNH